MAKRRVKLKKERTEVLGEWLRDRVSPKLLWEVVSLLKLHAESAAGAWPWSTKISPEHAIDGYSSGFDVNGGPGRGLGSMSGDVNLRVSVVVSFPESALLGLATHLSSLPVRELAENDLKHAVGRILCDHITTSTDVSITMRTRSAAEAAGHAHRYAVMSQLGLQLMESADVALWAHAAASILFDAEGFLEIVKRMKKK